MSSREQVKVLKSLAKVSPEEALQRLQELCRNPELRSYRETIGRVINSLQLDIPKLRLLGACTLDYMAPGLAYELLSGQLPFQVAVGAFDQILQELESQTEPYAVLVPWRTKFRDMEGELVFWRTCWQKAVQRQIRIVQVSYDWMRSESLGPEPGHCGQVRQLNSALRDELPEGHFFLDLTLVSGQVGRRQFYDHRNLCWTKQPFSGQGLEEFSQALVGAMRALVSGPKKVLVLDLDNTLWGGEVGDCGPANIGLTGAEGEAFLNFQAYLKGLSERGILLALASKNEEAIAMEALRDHPSMILRPEDFVATQIHWEPKSVSIRRIAEQLRLGLDSFVFFDDNPRERAEVRLALPQVEVVETSGDPFLYLDELLQERFFETLEVTDVDRARTQQYRAENQREKAKESVGDYLDFLQMEAEIAPLSDSNIARMVQLFARTNQFNLTTRRHGQEALRDFAQQKDAFVCSLALRDRFGDLGLISSLVALPSEDEKTLSIDSWVMSCRAMQRTVEYFFFDQLVQHAQERGYLRIRAQYLATKKNKPVSQLLPTLGFQDKGNGLFELSLESYRAQEHHID